MTIENCQNLKKVLKVTYIQGVLMNLETNQTNINESNWTFCHYLNGENKAFVSIGAEPAINNDVSVVYMVTLTDADHQEIFQSSHPGLLDAVAEINRKYGHWPFQNGLNQKSEGCTDCAAK